MSIPTSFTPFLLDDDLYGEYQLEYNTLDKKLHDREFPVLSLRKDIWTHFPVILVPLGTGEDGAERHAVVWHRKLLVKWREQRNGDFQSWADYEENTHYRLMKCLRASARWVVEPSANDSQICVIRMLYGNQAPVHNDDIQPREFVPLLTCLNDIKLYFPVVWHLLPSSGNTKMYAIELYEKKVKSMFTSRAELVDKLKKALNASSSWSVLPAVEGTKQVCRLETQ